MFLATVKDPAIVGRDAEPDRVHISFGASRVGASNLLSHLIASYSHYQIKTKIRRRMYTQGISKELSLNSCRQICIECTGPANRQNIPISHIRTDYTPTVTGRAFVTVTLTVTGTTPVTDITHFTLQIKLLHKLMVVFFWVRTVQHHRYHQRRSWIWRNISLSHLSFSSIWNKVELTLSKLLVSLTETATGSPFSTWSKNSFLAWPHELDCIKTMTYNFKIWSIIWQNPKG